MRFRSCSSMKRPSMNNVNRRLRGPGRPTLSTRLDPGSRVAIIRLRSLGDCVLSTPAIHLLKQARPDLRDCRCGGRSVRRACLRTIPMWRAFCRRARCGPRLCAGALPEPARRARAARGSRFFRAHVSVPGSISSGRDGSTTRRIPTAQEILGVHAPRAYGGACRGGDVLSGRADCGGAARADASRRGPIAIRARRSRMR